MVECGLLLRNELNNTDLQKLFKRLVDINIFDGLKKIDDDPKKGIALYSANNNYVMKLTSEDVIIRFVNNEINNIVSDNLADINEIIKDFLSISELEINIAKVRVVNISTSKKDRQRILDKVIAPAYRDRFDDKLHISLDFSNPKTDLFHYIRVTTNHTKEMHNIFEVKKKIAQLKHSITIDSTKAQVDEDYVHSQVIDYFRANCNITSIKEAVELIDNGSNE